MARGLTPSQPAVYNALRTLTAQIIRRAAIPERVVAQELGVTQGMISGTLNGRMTSAVTLMEIARVIMSAISPDDQRALQEELDHVVPLIRKPRR